MHLRMSLLCTCYGQSYSNFTKKQLAIQVESVGVTSSRPRRPRRTLIRSTSIPMTQPTLVDLQEPRLPVNAEGGIFLPADTALVEATPMLYWQVDSGTVPQRVPVADFQMLYAFCCQCDLSHSLVDLATTRTLSVFTACLTNTAWTRILVELIDSSLLYALEGRVSNGTYSFYDDSQIKIHFVQDIFSVCV